MADEIVSYDDMMGHDFYDQPSERLSDAQEKILAILPIPSAILSIFGSSVILYIAHKSRQRRKWTPYTRLLIGLSVCDIIASITVAISTFLRPSESPRAWSYGNDTTCSAIGFLTQVSYSAACYNAMLSFYFLMTARFGLKNAYIAKRFEPMMHSISIGYFLGTAIIGAILGVYADTAASLGCWVNDYPRNCGHEPGQPGEDCLSSTVGWIFFGFPFLLILVSLVVNNLLIYIFVRKQTRPLRQKLSMVTIQTPTTNQGDSEGSSVSSSHLDDVVGDAVSDGELSGPIFSEVDKTILDTSGRSDSEVITTIPSSRRESNSKPRGAERKTAPNQHKDQLRRLRLVSSQAFLFVANYALVVTWGGLMAIAEGKADSKDEELSMLVKIYPIMVLNAFFEPLQGFLNLLVYIRPKYLKWRHEYPRETRWWTVRRAIFGEDIQPQNEGGRPRADAKAIGRKPRVVKRNARKGEDAEEKVEDIETGGHAATTRLPRDMISSLTGSIGDFDHVLEEGKEDGRWESSKGEEKQAWIPVQRTSRFRSSLNSRGSSLGVISEMSESVFEPILAVSMEQEEHESFAIPGASESRWSSSSGRFHGDHETPKISESLELFMPRRLASCAEDISISDVSTDSPVRVPIRKKSLDSLSAGSDFSTDSPVRVPIRKKSLDSLSAGSDFWTDSPVRVPIRKKSLNSLSPCWDFSTDSPVHVPIRKNSLDSPSADSGDAPIRVPARKLSPTPTVGPALSL